MVCQLQSCQRASACCGLGETEPCFELPGVREQMQHALRKALDEARAGRKAAEAPAQAPPRAGAKN